MNYVVNWIPLRIRVRSRKTQPHIKFAPKALFNGAIPKLNFLVSGRISVVIIDPLTNKLMSTFLRNQDDSTMDLTELAVAMALLSSNTNGHRLQASQEGSNNRIGDFRCGNARRHLLISSKISETRDPIRSPRIAGDLA